MPTKAKIILEPSPTKNARIGQDIEERLPLRWYREGLGGLQVLVILVRRVEELCVGLPHALVGVAADDPSTAAEIEARCPIAQSQQGRRGLGISGLHQNAPHGSFGGWRRNADLCSPGGESLVSQGRVHFAATTISSTLSGCRGTAEELSKQVTHLLVRSLVREAACPHPILLFGIRHGNIFLSGVDTIAQCHVTRTATPEPARSRARRY